ncbi:hypothetical protein JY742_10435 [Clostridioides difficile]|nr:hypothetical protein [Clostridioides difficile]
MILILIDEQRYYNLLERNRELNMRIDELNEDITFLQQENKEYKEILNEWENIKNDIILILELNKKLRKRENGLEMIWHKIEDL